MIAGTLSFTSVISSTLSFINLASCKPQDSCSTSSAFLEVINKPWIRIINGQLLFMARFVNIYWRCLSMNFLESSRFFWWMAACTKCNSALRWTRQRDSFIHRMCPLSASPASWVLISSWRRAAYDDLEVQQVTLTSVYTSATIEKRPRSNWKKKKRFVTLELDEP